MKPTRLALLAAVAFAFASASAFAQTKKFDCSPGFWKNHQELWNTDANCLPVPGTLDCTALVGMLFALGPQNGVIKNLAADIINGWADENLATACEEES